ncbi:MAG: DNA polymerase III subunit delta [Oscillospiraceae bacterium]
MKKKGENTAYIELKKAASDGSFKNLYLFFGEERYLLEYYLGQMRKLIVAAGTEEFNHKRLDGKKLDPAELSEAVDALPVFSERTLIEVSDFDIFKCAEPLKEEFLRILSDVPDYICVVFVYDTIEYKPDGRVKINSALKKCFETVEFEKQEQSDLLNWIGRRFKALGKHIDRKTSEYLAFISGGLMTTLVSEIEKTAAYEKGETITRKSIDAVVTPVLDAVTYKMTDAILQKRFDDAAQMLSDLLRMREAPHRILYSVSMKMRQLLAAKVCAESGKGVSELMRTCGISYEFQARGLMAAERGASFGFCKNAVRLCSKAALSLNSAGSAEPEQVMSQLILELSMAV